MGTAPLRPVLAVLVFISLLAAPSHATCTPSGEAAGLADVVQRIEAEGLRLVFVGEEHGVGPVKRFAVELANRLTSQGHEVGLYVEGFRTGCPPRSQDCWSLAAAFGGTAFQTLLAESQAPVHPLDPPGRHRRADRMAEIIAAGSEEIRVVLVGRTHVVHAEDDEAQVWVYGGALRYPDPGDVAEAFPRADYLTIGLETVADLALPFTLQQDGCALDYVVRTASTPLYWGRDGGGEEKGAGPPAEAGAAAAEGVP